MGSVALSAGLLVAVFRAVLRVDLMGELDLLLPLFGQLLVAADAASKFLDLPNDLVLPRRRAFLWWLITLTHGREASRDRLPTGSSTPLDGIGWQAATRFVHSARMCVRRRFPVASSARPSGYSRTNASKAMRMSRFALRAGIEWKCRRRTLTLLSCLVQSLRIRFRQGRTPGISQRPPTNVGVDHNRVKHHHDQALLDRTCERRVINRVDAGSEFLERHGAFRWNWR